MADEELLRAAKSGDLALVKRLISNGANPYYSDEYGETALHKAAREGTLEVVKHLAEKEGVKVNTRNKNGHTPLHSACACDRLRVVEYLIRHRGCDIDDTGSTVLHLASVNGSTDSAQVLLFVGKFTPSTLDSYHLTPLDYAVRNEHPNMVKLFTSTRDDGGATSGK